ncbi:MAG: MBL fold metallo-hydrolase [Gemmatimonadota bacterium]|nr:MAG: MBL fold metallo-hydrolase [Gemmatimonadota bacterium]
MFVTTYPSGSVGEQKAVTTPVCIDLLHLGLEGAIACYLIDGEEPAIVDPGPTTTLERLTSELAVHGIGSKDLRHILLTHIHLDHAGATGDLCQIFPHATVYVHEDGAPHLADPDRLVASTRRTFGDAHDRLWGEMKPVANERIRVWYQGQDDPLEGTPSFADPWSHRPPSCLSLGERDGTLFSGDSMGIVLSGGPTHPPTPPPSVDLRAWADTLSEIRQLGSERFAVTHFGIYEDVDGRCSELQDCLNELEARVRIGLANGDDEDAQRFGNEVREELAKYMGPERAIRYFEMFSASIDWEGVAFYLKRNP